MVFCRVCLVLLWWGLVLLLLRLVLLYLVLVMLGQVRAWFVLGLDLIHLLILLVILWFSQVLLWLSQVLLWLGQVLLWLYLVLCWLSRVLCLWHQVLLLLLVGVLHGYLGLAPLVVPVDCHTEEQGEAGPPQHAGGWLEGEQLRSLLPLVARGG